jgi:hypothetical protein
MKETTYLVTGGRVHCALCDPTSAAPTESPPLTHCGAAEIQMLLLRRPAVALRAARAPQQGRQWPEAHRDIRIALRTNRASHALTRDHRHLINSRKSLYCTPERKGKPVARRGRKASGLTLDSER